MRIQPRGLQLKALAEADDGSPVVMLNLLKFKAHAQGEEGTGAGAYARYAAELERILAEVGGSVLFLGRASQVVIGDDAEQDWDVVLLVRYPSRAAFLEMIARPDYQDAQAHREAGLANTVLIACSPIDAIV
ncbi:MAG TPA: DUF1330 domain-containing protein [Actinomycetota bacterium]|nr:DUF1330 domain-containing protein [Actinomycetota bacterium]